MIGPLPRSARGGFVRDDRASVSVEFVVVFLGFIAVILFVAEITIYQFFTASLEKAAEAGARAAVVSPRMVSDPNGYLATNDPALDGGGTPAADGTPCGASSCVAWSQLSCGSSPATPCTGDAFGRVLDHMQGFNGRIRRENVKITYTYTGIGFAGGPSVPMITVTVKDVPFETGILGLLLRSAESVAILEGLRTLPPRSASMTGEDLAL